MAAPKRHGPDWVLLTIVIMLLIIGLIAVYSASYALGYNAHGDSDFFIKRQVMWAGVGCAGMFAASLIDYRWLRGVSPLLMLLALAGLGAALVPGIGVSPIEGGPSRWIEIGPLSGQPSELAKLAVIVYLAAWLAAKGPTVRNVALGGVPTTTPRPVPLPDGDRAMLEEVVKAEKRATQAYVQRAQDAEAYGDKGLVVQLEDFIRDESNHAEETERILRDWPL